MSYDLTPKVRKKILWIFYRKPKKVIRYFFGGKYRKMAR